MEEKIILDYKSKAQPKMFINSKIKPSNISLIAHISSSFENINEKKRPFSVLCTNKINKKNIEKFKDPLIIQIFTIMKKNNHSSSAKNIIRNYSSEVIPDKNYKEKLNNTIKTSDEMSKKFYIKYREAIKGIGKTNKLYSGLMKDPRKLRNKIMLDYRNVMDYDEEDIKRNKKNYERNLEYFENQYKMREKQISLDIKQFYKLKNRQINFNSLYKPIKYNMKNSLIKNQFKKFKYISKSTHSILGKGSSVYLTMEAKNSKCNLKKLYTIKNKIKTENFCNAINKLTEICGPFQKINQKMIKNNLRKKIFINKSNVERIIRISEIIKKGCDEEDYEENAANIRDNKRIREYQNEKCMKKEFSSFSKLVKDKNFNRSTIIRFNQLQGKNFGFPC